MQRRINKPKWAPSVYVKDMSAYRSAINQTPDERYKYLRAYIDEYGLTLVYEKEAENPRFRYKHYFSTGVCFYGNEIRQGISLSNILEEEIANGYEENARQMLWRNPKFKTYGALIKALRKEEAKEAKK